MNIKSKLLVVVAGMILATGAIAAAHGPRGDRGPVPAGAEVIQHMVKAMHRLDLSQDQKESIRQSLQGVKETMKPLAQEFAETRKALHEQITAETYDAEAVADIARRQGDLTAEMTMIASEAASGVLAQLTAEQRSQLADMAETRRAHRDVHRDMRKQRREHRDKDAD